MTGERPAFPVFDVRAAESSNCDEMRDFARGMSLRDYFAAAAMQGFIAAGGHQADLYVADCYAWADAMLVEREK